MGKVLNDQIRMLIGTFPFHRKWSYAPEDTTMTHAQKRTQNASGNREEHTANTKTPNANNTTNLLL
jgi:hypothetical protein